MAKKQLPAAFVKAEKGDKGGKGLAPPFVKGGGKGGKGMKPCGCPIGAKCKH